MLNWKRQDTDLQEDKGMDNPAFNHMEMHNTEKNEKMNGVNPWLSPQAVLYSVWTKEENYFYGTAIDVEKHTEYSCELLHLLQKNICVHIKFIELVLYKKKC